jgi:hypothetical protein
VRSRRHSFRRLLRHIITGITITGITTLTTITGITTLITIAGITITAITGISVSDSSEWPQHLLRPFPFPTRPMVDSRHE